LEICEGLLGKRDAGEGFREEFIKEKVTLVGIKEIISMDFDVNLVDVKYYS